mgnify:CR=1 FL=1
MKTIKIISVFDDWNFDPNSKTYNTKRNLPIANNSDVIIVKTESASKVLYKNTRLESQVIPDMTRFKCHNVYSEINYPFNVNVNFLYTEYAMYNSFENFRLLIHPNFTLTLI